VEAAVATVMPKREPRLKTDKLDVTQGQLILGFRYAANVNGGRDAAYVLNNILGGTPMSKLFTNVRERLSLAYNISSNYDSRRCVITVQCQIDFDKRDAVKNEVLAQIDAMRRGELDELEPTRMFLISVLEGIGDSAGSLEQYYLGAMADPFTAAAGSPEEYIEAVKRVTPEQIIEVAKSLELITIYWMEGK
jgi:predicted Zn-dependent peptidase